MSRCGEAGVELDHSAPPIDGVTLPVALTADLTDSADEERTLRCDGDELREPPGNGGRGCVLLKLDVGRLGKVVAGGRASLDEIELRLALISAGLASMRPMSDSSASVA